MNGGKLAGGNPANGRVDKDFYATDPKALRMLFAVHNFDMTKVLEPCVGSGTLAKTIEEDFHIIPTCVDVADYGYPNTILHDFLSWDTSEHFSSIITNPPYSLASEFVEKGYSLLVPGGQMAMFLKIQFLESEKRKKLFDNYPPRYIYVFRKRMATWANGQTVDPKTGKPWATTMCNAWYIWEKDWKGEPTVRWLD